MKRISLATLIVLFVVCLPVRAASLSYFYRTDVFTTTGFGTVVPLQQVGPVKYYSVQVKGTGAAPSSWTLTLECSLDNVEYTTVATHATGDGDGTVKNVSTPFPCTYLKSHLSAVSLGSATSLKAFIVGVQ